MTAFRQTLLSVLFVLSVSVQLLAQTAVAPARKPLTLPPAAPTFLRDTERSGRWADSIMADMPLEQQVAQLIMVAGYSNRTRTYEDSLTDLVRTWKLGGVVFFQGGPMRQAKLNNRLQAASQVPL
ncbi:MAG: serine hydrolase, partial [Cytophagaceae bacterium]